MWLFPMCVINSVIIALPAVSIHVHNLCNSTIKNEIIVLKFALTKLLFRMFFFFFFFFFSNFKKSHLTCFCRYMHIK